MAKENKPTVKQHFIPQFYLKNFSEDCGTIWQYNILKDLQTPVAVPIESICYEKNLYEFKDSNGKLIDTNLIENKFSKMEGIFDRLIRKVQGLTLYEKNYQTLSLLSPKDKALLIFLVATQVIRKPNIINAAQETAKEMFGDDISDNKARNIALSTCLPIYNLINTNEKNILNAFLKMIEDMSFQICISKTEAFFTSDNPVCLLGSNPTINNVIYPLTPSIILSMTPLKSTKIEKRNRLLEIQDDDIDHINRIIVQHADHWIYSKHQFTNDKITFIKEVRK